jgi:hypothetical protein
MWKNGSGTEVRSTGFEPVIASLEGLCPKPARRRPLEIELKEKKLF